MNHYDFKHRVTPDEIDAQQHVHNLRYLQWTLWAARDHNRQGGWDAAEALTQGTGWVVRDHQITYRSAAFADDEILIRTWVSELRSYASTRRYLITRPADQTLLARVKTRWVFADLEEHRALMIPESAKQAIRISESIPSMPWQS